MNRERAMLLADALDSGEYTQARGRLRGKDGFCCLGVACDLHAKEHNQTGWLTYNDPWGRPAYAYASEGVRFMPSEQVTDWFGFKTRDCSIPTTEYIDTIRVTKLSELNDNGWTFKQIAQYIRDHWAVL